MTHDSLQHLFFNCRFAKIVLKNSFWPLDSTAFLIWWSTGSTSCILLLGKHFGLPSNDHHLFQIFAYGACDLLWCYRIKSYQQGTIQDALAISKTINMNIIMPRN